MTLDLRRLWLYWLLTALPWAPGCVAQVGTLVSALAQRPRAEAPADPALRAELLAMMEVDQEARFALLEQNPPDPDALARVQQLDAAHLARLRAIVDAHGWPGRSLVGTDGAHAAWLLVQHADAEVAFQKRCLELMRALPPGEVATSDVAYLTDRVLVNEGQPQLYGTQLHTVNGELVPRPIADPDTVDVRRAAVGLMPLAHFISYSQAAYLARVRQESRAGGR